MLADCRKSCVEGCETVKYDYTISYRNIFAESDTKADWMKAYRYGLFIHSKNDTKNYDFIRYVQYTYNIRTIIGPNSIYSP